MHNSTIGGPMIRRVAFVLALAANSHAASARDVKIGELSVNVMPAPGQCELREDLPDEARIIKLIRDGAPGSEVLVSYADCRRLADIRRGQKTAPGDFSDFSTAKFSMNMQAPPGALKQLCAMMRKKRRRSPEQPAGRRSSIDRIESGRTAVSRRHGGR